MENYRFGIGDIVTRDGSDEHEVIIADTPDNIVPIYAESISYIRI